MSSSRSTGCLVTASIRQGEAGNCLVQVAKEEHNHEPFAHPSAHPSAHPHGCTLTHEARQRVLALTRAGVTSKRIVTLLQQNNNALAIAQDIRNLLHAECTRMLAGRCYQLSWTLWHPATTTLRLTSNRSLLIFWSSPHQRRRFVKNTVLVVCN